MHGGIAGDAAGAYMRIVLCRDFFIVLYWQSPSIPLCSARFSCPVLLSVIFFGDGICPTVRKRAMLTVTPTAYLRLHHIDFLLRRPASRTKCAE